MLQNGLYEQLINNALEAELSRSDKMIQTSPIDTAEAARVLARYIAGVAEQSLMELQDGGGSLQDQIALANSMIRALLRKNADDSSIPDDPRSIAKRAEQLLALWDRQDRYLCAGLQEIL